MTLLSTLFFFLALTLSTTSTGSVSATEVIQLTAPQFYDMTMAGNFSVIVDVRTRSEWDTGHIANATFMESLQNANTADEIASTADLLGCTNCPIAVYCRSGSRAAAALEKLLLAGFQGPLYNGLGVQQWTAEGYPLVNTSSVDPECKNEVEETCETRSAVEDDTNNSDKETDAANTVGIADDNNVTTTMAPAAGPTDAPETNGSSSSSATGTTTHLVSQLGSLVMTSLLVFGFLALY